MSLAAIVSLRDLDAGFILAPERYDPRRRVAGLENGPLLTDFASLINEQVRSAGLPDTTRYLILDTGDARRGLVITAKTPVGRDGIGSSKKRVRPGDVIISRLRPYLRQVAYVDNELAPDDVAILCSTEFYVLRSHDSTGIGFLVPYLLSARVQAALAAAQEGGHHPRIAASALTGMRLPQACVERRAELSGAIEQASRAAREAERLIASAIDSVASAC